MEYYVVCDSEGAVRWRGSGGLGAADMQNGSLEDGLRAYVVPREALSQASNDVDLAAVRSMAAQRVDVEAEAIRCLFLTPGAGQALTYQRKEAEARAHAAGGDAGPFMTAEAAARGMTVDALGAEIIAQADAWVAVGSAIEGRRMGAKTAIAAAQTIPAIAAAAMIDWTIPDAPPA